MIEGLYAVRAKVRGDRNEMAEEDHVSARIDLAFERQLAAFYLLVERGFVKAVARFRPIDDRFENLLQVLHREGLQLLFDRSFLAIEKPGRAHEETALIRDDGNPL